MRTGSPTWKIRFGPVYIDTEDLTQISFPRNEAGVKSVEEIRKDIEANGLQDPLEVNWTLEETKLGQLRIFKGNQRIQALRALGHKAVPCYVTIEGYRDTAKVGKVLQWSLSIPPNTGK